MEKADYLYAALYGCRNVCTGDDEQTRIYEEIDGGPTGAFLDLPEPLQKAVAYLVQEHGDYNGAYHIYIRWMIRQAIPERWNWAKNKALITTTAEKVFTELYEVVDDDYKGAGFDDKEDYEFTLQAYTEEWVKTAQQIMWPGDDA